MDINGDPFIRSIGGEQLRVVFDISVSPQAALSFADIRLYNLSKDTPLERGQSIIFGAGYENSSDTIFAGTIRNVLRERDGPSTATRLLCYSGSGLMTRGSANSSYGAGAKIVDVLNDIARSWPRQLIIDKEQFKDAPVFTSGYVIDGDIPQALNDLANKFNFDWLEERGAVVISKRGAERTTTIYDINQFTGMRGIPEVTRGPQGLGVNVSMSLNPYIRSNSRINVQSEYATFNTGNLFIQELAGDASVNGIYNVLSLIYKGDSHGDNWSVDIDGIRHNTEETAPVVAANNGVLIWGNRVSQEFRAEVRKISQEMNMNPNWLMSVMGFETGGTFLPYEKNPRSSATGLIQFLDSTARDLGTTTRALAAMTAVQQLKYVKDYYVKYGYASRVRNVGDAYMAVLWPAAIGKADSYIMWESTGPYQTEYNRNRELDKNRDGKITRGEALSRVNRSTQLGQKNAK